MKNSRKKDMQMIIVSNRVFIGQLTHIYFMIQRDKNGHESLACNILMQKISSGNHILILK